MRSGRRHTKLNDLTFTYGRGKSFHKYIGIMLYFITSSVLYIRDFFNHLNVYTSIKKNESKKNNLCKKNNNLYKHLSVN